MAAGAMFEAIAKLKLVVDLFVNERLVGNTKGRVGCIRRPMRRLYKATSEKHRIHNYLTDIYVYPLQDYRRDRSIVHLFQYLIIRLVVIAIYHCPAQTGRGRPIVVCSLICLKF